MPTYVYEVLQADGSPGPSFEWTQSMKEPPLTRHPETGQPVRRVIQPPHLGTRYTEGQTRDRLDNRNLEKAGFTKYQKDKLTGKYHRVAGKEGPATIDRPPPADR